MPNLSDYEKSLKEQTVMTAKCNGVECVSDGTESIPCLIFKADDFKFYMPYFELITNINTQEFSPTSLQKILFKFFNSQVTFVVKDISYEMRMGFVSKLDADEIEKTTFVNEYGVVDNIPLIRGKILSVSKSNAVINIYGLNKVIWAKKLPDIISKNLTSIYKVGDNVDCSLSNIEYSDDKTKLEDADLELLKYPTIPKDKFELLDESFYFGEIVSIRKNNTGVLVECSGNDVFCEYPTDFIPIIGQGASVKIIRKRQNKRNAYIGRIYFCEMPIGSY